MEPIGSQLAGAVDRLEAAVRERQEYRPRYVVILYEALEQLGLDVHEYVLADAIQKLSGSHSRVPGWCYASKEYLGSLIGVTERSVFRILKRLGEKGMIEVHPERPTLLRASRRWIEAVELVRSRTSRSTRPQVGRYDETSGSPTNWQGRGVDKPPAPPPGH